jgi:hypothetical protein
MHTPVQSRLLRAKQLLGESYDALNRAWQEAEDVIVSTNVGKAVAVYLCYEEQYECDPESGQQIRVSPGFDHYLGFLKHAGSWQICYGRCLEGFDWWEEHCSWRPIHQCSKEERVLAAKEIPQLLAAVVEEAEQVAAEVEAAVAVLNEAITPHKAG